MKSLKPTAEDLVEQVQYLEERVRALRLGRRILMNIIYSQVTDKQVSISRLKSENRRLQQANARYARAILESRNRIRELEDEIIHLAQSGRSFTVTSSTGHSSSS